MRVVESADVIVSLDDDASRDAFRLGVEAYVIQKKGPAEFLVRKCASRKYRGSLYLFMY